MTKREKLIRRFRENDKNVRFEEIDRLLVNLDFEKKFAGSHCVYRKHGIPPITIPFRKPFILPVYVGNVLKILDECLAIDQD